MSVEATAPRPGMSRPSFPEAGVIDRAEAIEGDELAGGVGGSAVDAVGSVMPHMLRVPLSRASNVQIFLLQR